MSKIWRALEAVILVALWSVFGMIIGIRIGKSMWQEDVRMLTLVHKSEMAAAKGEVMMWRDYFERENKNARATQKD